jgi:hypothetical protein
MKTKSENRSIFENLRPALGSIPSRPMGEKLINYVCFAAQIRGGAESVYNYSAKKSLFRGESATNRCWIKGLMRDSCLPARTFGLTKFVSARRTDGKRSWFKGLKNLGLSASWGFTAD